MKKHLPILFLMLFNAFVISAATSPPGGLILYISPVCQSSPNQTVITTQLTPGGTYSSFPGLSLNAVTGEIFTNGSAPGNYVVTYTVAANGNDPAYATTATIIITPEVVPVFQAGSITICEGSTPPPLLTTSYNGITGTWSPATVDTTVSTTYIFTPDAGQCAAPTTMNILVAALPTAMISGPGAILLGETATITFLGTPNATVTYLYNGGTTQTITLDATGTATITLPPIVSVTSICLISASSNGILNCTAPLSGCATIIVMPVPAPTGSTNQTFAQGATLADVVVSGSNIQWYDALGRNVTANPLPLNTPLVNGATYFASQTINGHESDDRLAVTVQVTLAVSQFDFSDLTYGPNPVAQVLNIKSSDVFSNIKVYNNLGQEVYHQKCSTFDLKLDLGFLKTGNYFIALASDKKHQVVQFIKK